MVEPQPDQFGSYYNICMFSFVFIFLHASAKLVCMLYMCYIVYSFTCFSQVHLDMVVCFCY